MKSVYTYLFLTLCLWMTSCDKNNSNNKNTKDGLEGEIAISGAYGLYPLTVRWGEEFQKIYPNVKITVTSGGAGKGINDALTDKVNLGMVSRDMAESEIEKGAWEITVARDAVLPTINVKNPYLKQLLQRGITKAEFYKIWISGEYKTWDDLLHNGSKDPIHTYIRTDGAGTSETWAKFLGKSQKDLLGTGVDGDIELAHKVSKDPLSMGFNSIVNIYDLRTQLPYQGLAVVPIDLDSNGTIDPSENFYQTHQKLVEGIIDRKLPAPPARELCFVSHGPPKDELLRTFFEWVLTDGQKFVPEMGYIRLSRYRTEAEVEILDSYIKPEDKK